MERGDEGAVPSREDSSTRSWPRAVPTATIVAVSLILALPYAVLGPGFFLDDWFALRSARVDGWYMAAGPEQWAARPGAGAIYAVMFGLVHDRPLVHYLLMAVLMTVAAVLIQKIAARFLSESLAVGIALGWLLLPNHTSLEMWPSAANITLALVLALFGVYLLTTGRRTLGRDAAAVIAMAAGTLTYEAVAPAAAGVVVAYAVRDHLGGRRERALRLSLLGVIGLGGAGVWMVTHWHPSKQGLGQWIDVGNVVPGHFGTSVFGFTTPGRLAALLALLTIAFGFWVIVSGRLRGSVEEGWMAAAGGALLVLGVLPFVRYFYAPLGLGDRSTVVSGVGALLILSAACRATYRWLGRPVFLVVAFLVIMTLHTRVEMVRTYATAADDGRQLLATVERRFPEPPDDELVFGPSFVVENNVAAFFNVDWAVHWLYGTREIAVRTTTSSEEFEQAPPAYRFDVPELLGRQRSR